MEAWRRRSRSPSLAATTVDRGVLSLARRSHAGQRQRSDLHRIRASVRKKRRPLRVTERFVFTSEIVRARNSSFGSWRNHTRERPLLSRSRSSRNSRHPPFPGEQSLGSRNPAPAAWAVLSMEIRGCGLHIFSLDAGFFIPSTSLPSREPSSPSPASAPSSPPASHRESNSPFPSCE